MLLFKVNMYMYVYLFFFFSMLLLCYSLCLYTPLYTVIGELKITIICDCKIVSYAMDRKYKKYTATASFLCSW